MDFRVFVEPQQGATYADQLAVAQTAESLDYSAFFRSDHYVAMSGDGIQTTTRTTRPTAPSSADSRRRRKPMSDFQAIADRVEIEALRGEFTERG